MGRKVEAVVVPNFGGRDDGKVFQITEMPAAKAEKWAWRLFIALKGTDGEVPPEAVQLGIAGVALRGLNVLLRADVRFELVEPLLDEMFDCVKIIRDKSKPDIATPLLDTDIEEVQTRGWLRSEVLRVHTGFSIAEGLSSLWRLVMTSPPASPTT